MHYTQGHRRAEVHRHCPGQTVAPAVAGPKRCRPQAGSLCVFPDSGREPAVEEPSTGGRWVQTLHHSAARTDGGGGGRCSGGGLSEQGSLEGGKETRTARRSEREGTVQRWRRNMAAHRTRDVQAYLWGGGGGHQKRSEVSFSGAAWDAGCRVLRETEVYLSHCH